MSAGRAAVLDQCRSRAEAARRFCEMIRRSRAFGRQERYWNSGGGGFEPAMLLEWGSRTESASLRC
jgi:hypothetical protein